MSSHWSKAITIRRTAAAILCVVFLTGCMDDGAPSPEPDKAPESKWRDVNGSKVIAAGEEQQIALDQAIAQARTTAENARTRWAAADQIPRERWAIKWAAPAGNQEVEYVWVRPVNWSPFRVEGVLISQPVAELECGKREGELVSFPIEELADWIYRVDSKGANAQGEFEGGYTVRALETHFGKP